MTENLLQQAENWRQLVLLAELGGWLHDLGKLSSGFILSVLDEAYSTGGETEPAPEPVDDADSPCKKDEWKHGKVLDEEEPYDGGKVPKELLDCLGRCLKGNDCWLTVEEGHLDSEKTSLRELVSGHHLKKPDQFMLRLLKHADQDDSGEDQYNAAELNQQRAVYGATVFGKEMALAAGNLESLDEARLGIYAQLAQELAKPGAPAKNREAIWHLLQATLKQGLGKTQRAANDVRLDQHAWGVATRFKSFVLRDLLDPPGDLKADPRHTFRLLTVLWNWWDVVTPFDRLSDVVGRDAMLDELRKGLRNVLEDAHAVGNRVYEDDDGVHFLVADVPWDEELTGLVRGLANQASDGEAQPSVRLSPPTRRVTDLVAQMETAKKQQPHVGDPAWASAWPDSPSNEVCPVCERRPLERERQLCEFCNERRWDGIQKRLGKGTVWTGEIADGNGRVALVMARAGLEQWLDGTMLHMMFITSPQDIAHQVPGLEDIANWHYLRKGMQMFLDGAKLESVKAYRNALEKATGDLERPDDPKIPQERLAVMREQARQRLEEARCGIWAALVAREMNRYGGEKGEQIRAMAANIQSLHRVTAEDAFLLALARKNPSASRLLRVWQTMQEFLSKQADALAACAGESKQRLVFTLEKPPRAGIYTAEVEGVGQVEVFVRPVEKGRTENEAQTIEGLGSDQIGRLKAAGRLRFVANEKGQKMTWSCSIKEVKEEPPYLPYQVITASPNLLLAMVPANKAVAVAEMVQQAYADEFGKVQGRLPFHVGVIFMSAHHPMFAALDTARRMAEMFDVLAEKPDMAELVGVKPKELKPEDDGFDLILHSDRYGDWTWHVPTKRGDGAMDWYHPYFLVKQGEDLEQRGMCLTGPYGRWVHVSELRAGDTIGFWPNLFDFMFLDTVSRRMDARLDQGRRPHSLLGKHSPRPYLLERAAHLRDVWNAICCVPRMSETKLAAAASLLARKWEEWRLADSDEHRETWDWLAEKTVAHDFGGNSAIEAAIKDGTFFDAVDLYRHILKAKVERPLKDTSEEEER